MNKTVKTHRYEQLGHEFVEIDLDDHPNVTILRGGTICIAVRDNKDSTNVNAVSFSPKPINVHINNARVN